MELSSRISDAGNGRYVSQIQNYMNDENDTKVKNAEHFDESI